MNQRLSTKVAMPIQPYIVLMSDNYRRIEVCQTGLLELGISHFYEFQKRNDGESQFDAVPDGSIDLLFNIVDDGTIHTYLSGTVFGVKRWELGRNSNCFGVRFQPGKGVLPRGISIDMIVNQDLEIDGNLYGKRLTESIAGAGSIEERARIFLAAYQHMAENAFSRQQDTKESVNGYVRDRISVFHGNITMDRLVEETGYSACYIRRIFKQYNGISPKQFAQYVRFQYLLHMVKDIQGDYAKMAAWCGYYDEPHMIKEFKSYAGVTPEKYNRMVREKYRFL